MNEFEHVVGGRDQYIRLDYPLLSPALPVLHPPLYSIHANPMNEFEHVVGGCDQYIRLNLLLK